MSRYNLSKPYDKAVLHKLQVSQVRILEDFIGVCNKYQLPYFVAYGTALGAIRHQGFIPWDDDTDVAMLRSDYEKFLEVAEKELGKEYRVMTPKHNENYACTVTHLQRMNTKFIPEYCKGANYEMCIDLDIFPLDYVANNRHKQKKQAKKTNILGKLLFLSGNKYPVIPYEGLAKVVLERACIFIHYGMKVMRMTPLKMYERYLKEATAYRNEKGEYVTSFENANALKEKIKTIDLFPTKEMKFENIMVAVPNNCHEYLKRIYGDYMKIPVLSQQINHMPYLIQFEGEEALYLQNVDKNDD